MIHTIVRRVVTVAASILLASPVLSLGAAPAPAEDVVTSYHTVKVADGIWAFIAPEPKSALASGNSVAIIGDDGVVVIDTGMIPALTRKMIAEIRQKTDKPVRYVVNTHWHWDHNFGNAVYRDAFPDVAIVSTPFTRRAMADYNGQMLAYYQRQGTAIVDTLRAQLASGKNRDGTTMTDEQRQAKSDLLHDAEEGMPQIAGGRLELPDATFDQSLTIHLGKREVDVSFPGRANTAGDAIAYVPDAKVLVTGDLVVAPFPFATGSCLPEWIAALKKMDAMDIVAIVPGHGAVERDKVYLETVTALLESVVAQVSEAVKDGASLEETRKRVDIGRYREQLTAGIASRRRNFHDYFEQPVVDNMYKQLKGEPTSEAPF